MSPPSASSSASAVRRPVTRLSQHFAQMMAECPQDIQVYGACVANIAGGVNRSACDAEFQKLKACFTRVVQERKALRR
ncbi:hypothetical protein ATCC90586_008651 [Pythium insidiosum]|nr:hypothetical protein ATCC90586_008651 [Pythium insidiosum]